MAICYRISRRELRHTLRAAVRADRAGAFEICGLLTTAGSVLRLIPLKNKVKRPCGFAFYAREVRAAVRAAERGGAEVVGTFHSHPFAGITPGRSDLLYARENMLMLIIDTFDRRVALWRICRRKAFRLWLRRADA